MEGEKDNVLKGDWPESLVNLDKSQHEGSEKAVKVYREVFKTSSP